jgi:hypothetical protein
MPKNIALKSLGRGKASTQQHYAAATAGHLDPTWLEALRLRNCQAAREMVRLPRDHRAFLGSAGRTRNHWNVNQHRCTVPLISNARLVLARYGKKNLKPPASGAMTVRSRNWRTRIATRNVKQRLDRRASRGARECTTRVARRQKAERRRRQMSTDRSR